MANKALSPEQARSLLVTQIVSSHNRQEEAWPSRKDKLTLYEAATKKKKKVTLSDGREYRCKYDTQRSIAWEKDKGYDVVFIQPTSGPLIPCGWFHIKFLPANGD